MGLRRAFGVDFGASFTIVVLLAFSLGTGALLFTAMDRLLLHPLRVTAPETLVRLAESRPLLASWQYFPPRMVEAARGMRSFSAMGAEDSEELFAKVNASVSPVVAGMVSEDYFALLGVGAEVGRALGPQDGKADSEAVVLSHAFAAREFGGTAEALGKRVTVGKEAFTVVGVMPAWFVGLKLDAARDLWLPMGVEARVLGIPEAALFERNYSVVGRLREGVSRAQAEAEFGGVVEGLKKSDPDADPASKGELLPLAQGAFALHDALGHAVTLLLGGLAVLLLMACANVAGLMLLKAERKRRESAVRLALGASRGHLLRRTLVGSLGLGAAGVAGAACVAAVGAPLLRRMLPPELAHLPVSLAPDMRIGLLAAGVGLGLTLLFGLAPAWMASRVAPQEVLRGGTATRRAGWGSRLLLVFQTAATLVLLVGTGLLLRTYEVLRHTSPGFDVGHLIAFTVDPEREDGLADEVGAGSEAGKKAGMDLPADLQRRVEALPGVQGATVVDAALMQRIGMKTSAALPGPVVRPPSDSARCGRFPRHRARHATVRCPCRHSRPVPRSGRTARCCRHSHRHRDPSARQ